MDFGFGANQYLLMIVKQKLCTKRFVNGWPGLGSHDSMISQDIDLLWQQALDESKLSAEQAHVRFAELIIEATVDHGLALGEDTEWITLRWGF
jgi:hypothetical protein